MIYQIFIGGSKRWLPIEILVDGKWVVVVAVYL